MGITIDWKGTETTISSSNAYAIYEDWVQGEIDLSTSQIKACESFLDDEEIEEIEYNNGGDEKTGAAALGEDAENAENSSNQTGNTAVAAVGMGFTSYAIANNIKQAGKFSEISGFSALAWAVITLAEGVLCKVLANAYDSDYDNRTQARDNADTTNSTLDGYTSSLEENFDAMNEDADAYSEATDVYTTSVNENVSKKADLEVQLAAAEAAGDTAGAESLRNEIKACEEEGSEISTDEMDELKENMEEYGSLNSEAAGASGAGQSVADFLKTGTALGAVATVETAWLAVATVAASLAIASALKGAATDAAKWNWPGSAAGIAGSIMYAAAAVLVGSAATTMASKAKNEFECGSAGSGMQGHVSTLNDMIEEHSEYMEAATESYDETDEESQESQEEAQEAAAEVTSNSASTTASTKKKEEEEETTV